MPTRDELSDSFFIFAKDNITNKVSRVAVPTDFQVGTLGNPAELQLLGRLSFNTREVNARNGDVIDMSDHDTILCVSSDSVTASGSVRINLPSRPRDGQFHYVKDISGFAGDMHIELHPQRGYRIESGSFAAMSSSRGSVSCFWRRTGWHVFATGGTVMIDATTTIGSGGGTPIVEGQGIDVTPSGPNTQVSIENSGVVADTYVLPQNMVVDSMGRITSVDEGIWNAGDGWRTLYLADFKSFPSRTITSSIQTTVIESLYWSAYGGLFPPDGFGLESIISFVPGVGLRFRIVSGGVVSWYNNIGSGYSGGVYLYLPLSQFEEYDPTAQLAVIFHAHVLDGFGSSPQNGFGVSLLPLDESNSSLSSNFNPVAFNEQTTLFDNRFGLASSSISLIKGDRAAQSNKTISTSSDFTWVRNISQCLVKTAETTAYALTASYDGTGSFPSILDHGLTSYVHQSTTLATTSSLGLAIFGSQLNPFLDVVFTRLEIRQRSMGIVSGTVIINTGSIPWDDDASFVILSPTSSLPSARTLLPGAGIAVADGGPGGDVTITNTRADLSGQAFLTVGNTATLSAERALTAGTGLRSADGGANSTFTLSINDGVVATVSGTRFTGPVRADGGLSGSLQQISVGVPYLIAGPNITVNTASNGQVSITGSAGGGGGSGENDATYLVLSNTSSLNAERVLTVSGSTGLRLTDAGANSTATLSINNSIVATVSGTTFTGATIHNAGLSGSLTNLIDGTSYIIAGEGVSVATQSNGAVLISSTGGGSGGGASTSASYVVMSAESGLNSERVLTAGAGISIVDGGANSTVTISTTNVSTGTLLSATNFFMPNPTFLSVSSDTIPGGQFAHQVIALSGTIYSFGPFTHLGTPTSGSRNGKIYYVSASAPTTWITTSVGTMPNNHFMSQGAVVGNKIFSFGGFDHSVVTDKIYSASVSNPLVWSDTGAVLPAARQGGSLVVSNGKIIIYGGRNDAGTLQTSIISASVNSPLTWVATGETFPDSFGSEMLTFLTEQNVYITGGHDGSTSATNRVLIANINSLARLHTHPTTLSEVVRSTFSPVQIGRHVWFFCYANGTTPQVFTIRIDIDTLSMTKYPSGFSRTVANSYGAITYLLNDVLYIAGGFNTSTSAVSSQIDVAHTGEFAILENIATSSQYAAIPAFLTSSGAKTLYSPSHKLGTPVWHSDNALTIANVLSSQDTGASYVTLGASNQLANERVLAGGSGITITDNGPGSTVVVSSNITTGSDDWIIALDINFSTLPSQSISDGNNTIAGYTWIAKNVSAASHGVSIAPGDGLSFNMNGTNSNLYYDTHTGAQLVLPLGSVVPNWTRSTDFRLYWQIASGTNSNANFEGIVAGLKREPFVANQSYSFEVYRGFDTSVVVTRPRMLLNATEPAIEAAANGSSNVGVIEVLSARTMNAYLTQSIHPYSTDNSTIFVEPASMTWMPNTARDIQAGTTTIPYLTGSNTWAISLGAQTGNTTDSFTASIQRIRLEYRNNSATSVPSAPADLSYIVLTGSSNLSAERVLTSSAGIRLTDAGVNSTLTVGIDNSVIATVSGTTFTGPVSASNGLSGSLQRVGPDLPYLIASGNISTTTASTGQIIINTTAGWQTALDRNFTQDSSFGFNDGNNSWNGVTWVGENITASADSFGVVNGTGLVLNHNATNTVWYYTADSAPKLYVPVTTLIPSFVWGESELRITAMFDTAGTTSFDLGGIAVEKPFTASQNWTHKLYAGYVPGYARYGQILMEASEGGVGAVLPNHKVSRLYIKSLSHAVYSARSGSILDTDSNDSVFVKNDYIVTQVWSPGTAGSSPSSVAFAPRLNDPANARIVIAAQTGNTNNNCVLTIQRLRVEYKL